MILVLGLHLVLVRALVFDLVLVLVGPGPVLGPGPYLGPGLSSGPGLGSYRSAPTCLLLRFE